MMELEPDNLSWMPETLVCPEEFHPLIRQHNSLYCKICHINYPVVNRVPRFRNPPDKRRQHIFEVNRYDKIALKPPETYNGYVDSHPLQRADYLAGFLRDYYRVLNTGPGFGWLEQKLCPTHLVYSVDLAKNFLEYLQGLKLANNRIIEAYGERLPFKSNYMDAIVSDSVFQTVVDQSEFLTEQARVLRKDGVFILTVTYKWNYPRKPQIYPADKPDLLINFLDELGVNAVFSWVSMATFKLENYESGDMLLIKGYKYEETPY